MKTHAHKGSPRLWYFQLLLLLTVFVTGAPAAGAAALFPDAVALPELQDLIRRDFIRHDGQYEARRHIRNLLLESLSRKIQREEVAGRQLPCSSQIYAETKWLLRSTARWDRIDESLDRLEKSIAVRDQNFALSQSEADGSWGGCYTEPFLKLAATVDALDELAGRGGVPNHRLYFLSTLLTREHMISTLESLLISDVARTGADHRDQLNSITTSFAQLLFKSRLHRYLEQSADLTESTSDLAESLRAFLDDWQDPASGYWGALYRSQGRLYRSNDLSITFHVVSYRHGAVARWPKIVSTLLETRHRSYPYGWLHNGQFTHHHNYDVAKLFHYGWPYMSEVQRETARASLRSMLSWCLVNAINPHNGAVMNEPPIYESLADNYYFALSFLQAVGFWNAENRFWTREHLGASSVLCTQLKGNVTSRLRGIPMGESALRRLPADCVGVGG